MKKKIQQFFSKHVGISALNALALLVAVGTVNTCCAIVHHQPEVPASLKAMRKF